MNDATTPFCRPLREAEGPAAGAAAADLGTLPVWDLSALYAGEDDPKLEADLTAAERDVQAFAERYEGKLAGLDGDALAEAIAGYEKIEVVLGRVMSFAGLRYAQNTQDPAR
ncbi:MAG: hypothetical protein AAFQ88_13130, partial [Pseudomonadota bacterium]